MQRNITAVENCCFLEEINYGGIERRGTGNNLILHSAADTSFNNFNTSKARKESLQGSLRNVAGKYEIY